MCEVFALVLAWLFTEGGGMSSMGDVDEIEDDEGERFLESGRG